MKANCLLGPGGGKDIFILTLEKLTVSMALSAAGQWLLTGNVPPHLKWEMFLWGM